MEVPQLLKTSIAKLDADLEQELSRHQYWRKHGRAPSVALKFTQRSKPIPPEPLPVMPQIIEPEVREVPVEPPPPVVAPEVQESWLDWQTAIASVVAMVVLGTVGYIGAGLLIPPPTPPQADESPVSVVPPAGNQAIDESPVSVVPPVAINNQPIVVYRVIVDRQYLDRVQAIEPDALVRPADGVVEVRTFESEAEAQGLVATLREQNIPARIE